MASDKKRSGEKLQCSQCKKEIPHSVAHQEEGADYILHFCSDDCRDHYFKYHPELKKPKRK